MCGRFFVEGESENELLARMIDEASRRQQAITGESSIATGEVFPTSIVAAMTIGRSGNIGIFPMTWGFHLPPNNTLIINTRSETAMEKPMFRTSMLDRRCLIPCSWYFEWGEADDGPSLQIGGTEKPPRRTPGGKTKYAIRPRTPGIMYLAGIYRYEQDRRLPVLSVLTKAPSPEIAFIHGRMPVIFSDRTHGAWLDRKNDPREVLRSCENAMEYRPA
jgi:putative SOS response-associated peptidase YedK